MPHDVTMPQLGMAQDAGRIVAWLKAPGEAVAKGDGLFKVETDKATMDVEAQVAGFLTGVSVAEGEDVPVGAVIARISQTAEDRRAATGAGTDETDVAGPEEALPSGTSVTMPQLGMTQDTGLLVAWQKALGDTVAADDILFEVETDKSTMEVPAGTGGYLAATLAAAGEEVPVGDAVAIISAQKPDHPVARAFGGGSPAAPEPDPAPETAARAEPLPARAASPAVTARPAGTGRILASPKMRRLAREEGLDLAWLRDAGHKQPFHVRDLEALRALTKPEPAQGAAAMNQRLVAEVPTDGLPGFAAWAAAEHGLDDADAILAGLAGASLPDAQTACVMVERYGHARSYRTARGMGLSGVMPTDDAPSLILRDMRGTALRAVELGGAAAPVLTLIAQNDGLSVTLECTADQLAPQAALTLITEFAGRMEQPLRHLL